MAQTTDRFVAPTDPQALVAWLENKKDLGRSRLPELQYKMNLAFMLGHQWIVWDRNRNQFRRPKVRPDDPNAPVRITANKIAGIAERNIAKLTRSAPLPESRPVSDSQKDVDTAKVGTRVLNHEMNRVGWEPMLTELYGWVTTLGHSYLHPRWDPNEGPMVGTQNGKNVHQGDNVVEIVPGFELAVDPAAKTMKRARWAVRTTSMTKEEVYERYGKLPEGAAPGRSLSDEVYQLTGRDDATGSHGAAADEEFIQVHQFWATPGGRANPKGLVVTWAGKTILEGPMPFPYSHGVLPFVQFDLLPGLGTREGRTWVNDLLPLQIDYNDARSREAMVRRMLVPKLLAPTGAIDAQRVTARVEVIPYNPVGAAPTWSIPDSGWLAQYEEGMKRADMEMGERAGQQDVSSGRAPSASMPAAAILALQEADDTKLAISVKSLTVAIQELGWQVLMLCKQFWTEERLIRAWSTDGSMEVTHFSGSDIGDQLDVHLSAESAMPRSKSGRTQLAMELRKMGVPAMMDDRTFVRALDLPDTEFITEGLNVDARQARRENSKMAEGSPVPINSFDNHGVHAVEHDLVRKGEDYESWAPEDPRRLAFDAHAAAHQEIMAQMLNAQAAQEAPAPPGGQGPGGAHGPGLYNDPLTGKPPSSVDAAAGHGPSALSFGPAGIRRAAGIGGAGKPGPVKGASPDQQAASMGR